MQNESRLNVLHNMVFKNVCQSKFYEQFASLFYAITHIILAFVLIIHNHWLEIGGKRTELFPRYHESGNIICCKYIRT